MKMIKNITVILLGFCLTNLCIAQNSNSATIKYADKEFYLVDSLDLEVISESDRKLLDSCLTVFHKAKEDTSKVDAINQIVEVSLDENLRPKYKIWLYHFLKEKLKQQHSTITTKRLKIGLAVAINEIGFIYINQGDLPKALDYFHKSLAIHKEMGDKKGIAGNYNNIGFIYNRQGDISKALDYYHKSIAVREEIGDKEGTTEAYNNIGLISQLQGDIPKALDYFHKSLAIQKEIGDKKGIALSYSNFGFLYREQGDIPKALDYHHKSLAIQKEIGNKKGIARSHNNIGFIYDSKGDIPKALDYYHKSLAVREEIGDIKGIAVIHNNIGAIYYGQGDLPNALDYFHKSLVIREEIGDKKGIAGSINNIGFIYMKQGDMPKALDYYHKSLANYEEMGDKKGISITYNNIGFINDEQGNFPKALDYYYKSLAIKEEIGDKEGMVKNYSNIGNIELEHGSVQQAKENGLKSLNLAQELGYPDAIKNAASLLTNVYEKQGKGMEALKMHKLFIVMRDSINNETTQKAAIQQNVKYEYEKQKAIDDLKNEQLLTIEKEEKDKQRVILYGIGAILTLVIVFSGFLFSRYRVSQKQKLVIDKTNSELNIANENYQMLLVESNHRIKNNLQMILSMLEYKAIKSGKRSEELEKITGNIKAISSLHKHLSLDIHNPYVDLVVYLKEIVSLYKEFSSQNFEVKSDLKAIDIQSERIVYFGLLFNEMLSNTIEHSLSKDTKMEVHLQQEKDGFSFSYKDGAAWNNDKDAGLGSSLIPELVERVEGENYSLDSTQGLYYFEFES
ncbi:MAG: hypothetical protein COB15_05585 [Flavobacteriales bacterium]|nr:MAG: hypothetical protein COB15_05585 [Flavobacteriales bacterium]